MKTTMNSAQVKSAQTQRPFPGRRGRWLSLTALALLTLCSLLLAYDRIASAVEVRRFPPAGEMVNVGTHSLHLHCQGNGSPTVLVEAGSGSWSLDWRTTQEQIARTTRVCVYDRAGYGWSEAGPTPRTGSQMVDELHTLVTNAGIERPFVLIAHSFGGLTARIYADQYPEEVAGLVLLDTRHEDFTAAAPQEVTAAEEGAASSLQVGLLLERTGLIRLLGPLLAPPPQGVPETLHPLYRAHFYQDKFLRALANEGRAMATTEAEAAQTGNLGDTPLIVLTHDPQHPMVIPGLPTDVNRQVEELWQQTQQAMTNLSSDSRFIVAEDSGHNIHVDRPDLVSDVITQMISMARGR